MERAERLEKLFTSCKKVEKGMGGRGGEKLINAENPSMVWKSGRTARTQTRRI